MAGELDPWTTRTAREVYRNPWLRLEEHVVDLPNGAETLYGIVRCSPCVGMLPFVDNDTVLLVGQYRYIIERPTWEMPTGGQHRGETPEDAAQRELAEEVGVRAATLTRLTAYNTSKSVVDETATLFLASGLSPAEAPPDDTELLVRRTFPFDEAVEMTLSGEIVDGMSVIAILWADRLRRLGQFPG